MRSGGRRDRAAQLCRLAPGLARKRRLPECRVLLEIARLKGREFGGINAD